MVNSLHRHLPNRLGLLVDSFAGSRWTIRFDQRAGRATLRDEQGVLRPAVVGYWFAWYAFHPDTAVFRVQAKVRP